MFQYLPIQSEVTSPELGTYRAFGLRVFQVQNGVDEEVMILPDISTSFLFTLRLAALFTRKQLDPAHLLDVIADFLYKLRHQDSQLSRAHRGCGGAFRDCASRKRTACCPLSCSLIRRYFRAMAFLTADTILAARRPYSSMRKL